MEGGLRIYNTEPLAEKFRLGKYQHSQQNLKIFIILKVSLNKPMTAGVVQSRVYWPDAILTGGPVQRLIPCSWTLNQNKEPAAIWLDSSVGRPQAYICRGCWFKSHFC